MGGMGRMASLLEPSCPCTMRGILFRMRRPIPCQRKRQNTEPKLESCTNRKDLACSGGLASAPQFFACLHSSDHRVHHAKAGSTLILRPERLLSFLGTGMLTNICSTLRARFMAQRKLDAKRPCCQGRKHRTQLGCVEARSSSSAPT